MAGEQPRPRSAHMSSQALRLDMPEHCAMRMDKEREVYAAAPFLSFVTGWHIELCNDLLLSIACKTEPHLQLVLMRHMFPRMTRVVTTLEGLRGLVLAFNDCVLPRYKSVTIENLRSASDSTTSETLADLCPAEPSLERLSLQPQQTTANPRDWGVNDEDRSLHLEMLRYWRSQYKDYIDPDAPDQGTNLPGEDAYFAFLERALATMPSEA